MADKIEFDGTGDGDIDNGVHFTHHNMDFTLCGRTLDNDPSTAGGFKIVIRKKVDCRDCIEIIKHCKSISEKEYITQTNK